MKKPLRHLLFAIPACLMFPACLLAQASADTMDGSTAVAIFVLLGVQGLFIGVLLVERAKRKRVSDALKAAARVAGTTGETFFRALAEHLNNSVHADYVSIGELVNDGRQIRTVAVSSEGRNLENLEYELDHTPCQRVLELGRFLDCDELQSHFPEDKFLLEMGFKSYLGVALVDSSGQRLGVMSVMSRRPMKDSRIAELTLDVFASRVSAEMERRRSERALRTSEAGNRAILNAMPDVMFVLDRTGRLLHYAANDSNELFAHPEPVLGKNILELLPVNVAETIGQMFKKTTAQEEPRSREFSLPLRDGVSYYEMRMSPLDDDRVLMIVRNVTGRKQAELELEKSRRFTEQIARTVPNVLFVYDLVQRRNVYVNQRSWEVIGYTAEEVLKMGDNFLERSMHPEDLEKLPKLAEQYATAKEGEVFEHVFRMRHRNGEWRWVRRYATIFTWTPDGRPREILGTATDITDLKRSEEELRLLSARLIATQDQERRRIARELHDGTAQNLFALRLNLGLLEQHWGTSAASNIFLECQTLCEASLEELRTLSYSLYPPVLDEGGLIPALRWFVQGFARRSGLDIKLESPPEVDRLDVAVERDLFRIVQEGLANIHRHSGSKSAVIRIRRQAAMVTLEMRDFGHGMSPGTVSAEAGPAAPTGVGITSMRERLRQIGGRLEIKSSGEGTTIIVTVPQPESSDSPPRAG